MKKCIIVLLVLLVSAGMAFGQDVLDPLYLEWGIRGTAREFLYPEVQYDRNPSVLVGLENVFLRPRIVLDRESTVTTSVRGDDTTGGEEGTTEEETDVESTIDLNVKSFFPIDDDMVLGADVWFARRSVSNVTETDEDYFTGDPEEIEENLRSNWDISGTTYGAFGLGGIDVGLALGGSLSRTPGESQEFKTTVDGETEYTDAEDDITDYELSTAAGVNIPVGDGTFGLGATFSYGVEDILPWSVDPDDDSQIIPYTDRDDVHDYLERTTDTRLSFYPSFVFPVSPQVSVISTGMVRVIDTEVSEFYDRPDEDDESLERETWSGTFPTFELGAGVAWRASNAVELRTGLNVSRSGSELQREQFMADGESVYDDANTIGAPEVALGADPETHEIIDDGLYMGWDQTVATIESGLTFSPVGPVTLFTGGGVRLLSQSATYKAFNTDTNAIVEATDDAPNWADNLTVAFNTTFGAAVELGDNMLASFHAGWPFNAITARSNTVDENPGGIDDEERRESDFGVDLQMIFRF